MSNIAGLCRSNTTSNSVEFTPETWDDENIHQCQYAGPFVVKGKMKSRKWQWKSLMFAATKREALRIGQRLMEDSEIGEQGVVYRRFVPLKTFGLGKDGLPQTNEWRFFYYGTQRLSYAYYWPGSDYLDQAAISDDCASRWRIGLRESLRHSCRSLSWISQRPRQATGS